MQPARFPVTKRRIAKTPRLRKRSSQPLSMGAILDTIDEAIIVTNKHGRIRFWNRKAEWLFGVTQQDAVGFFIQEIGALSSEKFAQKEAYEDWMRFLAEAPLQKQSREFEQVHPRRRVLRWYSTPVGQDIQGQPIARVHVVQDVSKEKRADRMKADFISSVSHELRTPLTSILGFSKIIKRKLDRHILPSMGQNDEKSMQIMNRMAEEVGIIVLEGERLTELVNDLLDMASIQEASRVWQMQPLNLSQMVGRAIQEISESRLTEQLTITLEESAQLPYACGDHERIQQVIANLLSNAAKFAPAGEICVYVSAFVKTPRGVSWAGYDGPQDLPDGHWTLVSVRDSGPGLTSNQLRELFQPFEQLNDILTAKPKGAGLGLALGKDIIELHGGRIWATSQLDQGCRFSFVLPAVPQDSAMDAALY